MSLREAGCRDLRQHAFWLRTGHCALKTRERLERKRPEAYKSDIAGLVAANHDRLAWSESFLDGIREDHLADVVIKGIVDSKA